MEELDSKYSRMEERVVVAGRYVMLAFEKRVGQWNIYEGIERNQKVPVIIHVKLVIYHSIVVQERIAPPLQEGPPQQDA